MWSANKIEMKEIILTMNKLYNIIILTALLFCTQVFSQEEQKKVNLQTRIGMDIGSPLTFGLELQHNKRFTTGLYGGIFASLYQWSGYEIGIDNAIYKNQRKNKGELSKWYWHQALFYSYYHSYELGPEAIYKFLGLRTGIGRTILITPKMGLNIHGDILFRYYLWNGFTGSLDKSPNVDYPFPSVGVFFFYNF